MTNLSSWIRQASHRLKAISDTPSLDAELLASHVLQKNRTFLYTYPDTKIDETRLDQLNTLLKIRETGKPMAYILGQKAFWTLTLRVNEATLIPRAETELLVENALLFLKKHQNPTIIELGTGSGAIALSIAKERPDATIYATDISEEALAVAKDNANQYQLQNVQFVRSNWFEALPNIHPILIVSNPPYIQKDSPLLDKYVEKFEPSQALISHDMGLADIKHIIQNSPKWLQRNGMLLIEFGQDQDPIINQELNHCGYKTIRFYSDMQHIVRSASAIW